MWDSPHIEDEESSEETSSSESSDSSESDSEKEMLEEEEEEENIMGSVTRVLSPVKFLVGKWEWTINSLHFSVWYFCLN